MVAGGSDQAGALDVTIGGNSDVNGGNDQSDSGAIGGARAFADQVDAPNNEGDNLARDGHAANQSTRQNNGGDGNDMVIDPVGAVQAGRKGIEVHLYRPRAPEVNLSNEQIDAVLRAVDEAMQTYVENLGEQLGGNTIFSNDSFPVYANHLVR